MNSSVNKIDYPGVAGKCFLVTGASSGIGRACAILLDQLGAVVILNGRNMERLEDTRKQMHGECHVMAPGDLLEIDFPSWLNAQTEKAGMPLSGLAHCFGTYTFTPLRAYTSKKLADALYAHVVMSASLFHSICAMKNRSDRCSLVFMNSISAHYGINGNAIYGSVRAALESLCRSFAVEYAKNGIRCNNIVGGLMEGSGMVGNFAKLLSKNGWANSKDYYLLGLGHVSDAANAIVFLLGSASDWITGTSITVDGGYSTLGV